jgi:hypothetical protein
MKCSPVRESFTSNKAKDLKLLSESANMETN